jgi:Multidrug resistance efflux pump
MKFKKLFTLFTLFVIMTASCSSNTPKQSGPTPADTENQPVVAFGVIKAAESLEINLGFPVKINRIFVTEGAKIKENDLLAEIDYSEFQKGIELKNKSIAALKDEIEFMSKMLKEKRELLESGNDMDLLLLEKKLENSVNSYEKAKSELAVKKNLFTTGAISESELATYSDTAENIQNAVDELKISLAGIKENKQNELLTEEMQLDQKEYQLSVSELEIKSLNEKASDSCIKRKNIISELPNSIIEHINCKQGEVIPAGSPIISIMNLDTILIEANVDEQFIKNVRLGAKAFIIPEIDRSQEYKGTVTFISSMALQQNGETVFPVQIKLDKMEDILLPGCNVEINIMTDKS